MKRVFLCLALIAAMVMGAEAQNRSIDAGMEEDSEEGKEGEEVDIHRLLHFLVRPLQDVGKQGVHAGCRC